MKRFLRVIVLLALLCTLIGSAGAETVWKGPLSYWTSTATQRCDTGVVTYYEYVTNPTGQWISVECLYCGAPTYRILDKQGGGLCKQKTVHLTAGDTIQFYTTNQGTNIAYSKNSNTFSGFDITAHYHLTNKKAASYYFEYTTTVPILDVAPPCYLLYADGINRYVSGGSNCSCNPAAPRDYFEVGRGWYDDGWDYPTVYFNYQESRVLSANTYTADVGVQYYIEDLVLKNATTNGFTLYASRAVQINGGSYKGAPA